MKSIGKFGDGAVESCATDEARQGVTSGCGRIIPFERKREISPLPAPSVEAVLLEFDAWGARQTWPSPEAERAATFVLFDLQMAVGSKSDLPGCLRVAMAEHVAALAETMKRGYEANTKPFDSVASRQSFRPENGA